MSTNLLPFRPTPIQVSASARKADPKPPRNLSSSNWWTPLFGWSSEPDYIVPNSNIKPPEKPELEDKSHVRSGSEINQRSGRLRFAPGCFTEEKAKQLRMMTSDTLSFHDAMYHSAIASRLASDFGNRSDK